MGLRIKTNMQAITAQRSLRSTERSQSEALAKLSSGQRINKASDDAAGLAISEKLKANIRGTKQAQRNASDGISLVQVAEGGLNEVSSILVRLRELSVQSASDTVGDKERGFADLEFQQLTSEIDRIAQSTRFNGRSLLNGEGGNLEFQVGILNNADKDRIGFEAGKTNATTDTLGVSGLVITSKGDAQENLTRIDEALDIVNGNRANLGALQNRLQSTVDNLQVKSENLSAANSRIRDTDVAEESSNLARANILSAANLSVLAQANTSKNSALKLIS